MNDASDNADSSTLIRVSDHPTAIALATQIVANARRRVWIRSLDMESWLFDHADLLTALRDFATAGRDGQVLILLHDATAPQAAHAKLLELAQRLPSVFQFREVDDPVYREDRSAMLANDVGDYYTRTQGERVEGIASTGQRARVRQLQQRFDEIWERARVVSEYRTLGI